ncbi:MAG: hypothetical protein EA384_09195 [Spirochaetaceae bacterium]|nr:MAG: hypothetical protein EA384_09195 [Spirochaetaceae bacterium]
MTRRACLASLILFLFSAPILLPAQEAVQTPPWVLYEQGMQLLEQGRFGEALRRFRAAARQRAPFPEAEVGIGRVLQAEGSFDLAVRQYRTALEQSYAFEVPQTAYLVRYLIADVHRLRGDSRAYEQKLLEIAGQEAAFSDPGLEDRRAAYLDVLRNRGLDRLMVLYRIDDGFSHRAHRELGMHLFDHARDGALEHLTFAVMKGFTRLVGELRQRQFDYRYTTAVDVLADAHEVRYLSDYLEREDFYRTLYYLGLALERETPSSETAVSIWRTLAALPEAGEWYLRALERVAGPSLRRR